MIQLPIKIVLKINNLGLGPNFLSFSLLDGYLLPWFLFSLLSSGLCGLWLSRGLNSRWGLNFLWPAWHLFNQGICVQVRDWDTMSKWYRLRIRLGGTKKVDKLYRWTVYGLLLICVVSDGAGSSTSNRVLIFKCIKNSRN